MFHKITEGLSLITKECAKNINKINFFYKMKNLE